MNEATSALGALGYLELLLDKGGPLMIPILACSVLGVAIIVERLIFLSWSRERTAEVFAYVEETTRSGQRDLALEYCQRSRGALARTLGAAITQFDQDHTRFEETLLLAGQEQIAKLDRRLRALEVMAVITPLLGLLGTVTGMMQAFHKVSAAPGAVSPALLAGGIWEALLTTAAGLTVAIPLLIFLHYFDRTREKKALEIEKYGTLFTHLKQDLEQAAQGRQPKLTAQGGGKVPA